MTGPERRTAIINQIKTSSVPVPGKALAAHFEVSRQVIVQDIALIRAAGHDIISTNRGYILHESHLVEMSIPDEKQKNSLMISETENQLH